MCIDPRQEVHASAYNINDAKAIATIPTRLLMVAPMLAPATWTGVDVAVVPAVPEAPVLPAPPVALEPLIVPAPPVAVAVAFEPPAEGEAVLVAFIGSTAGSYLSQTAPSANGHYRLWS